MEYLVIGGTGTVGGEVVRDLLARGHRARVLTRSAAKAGTLPEGAEGVVGDLAYPAGLRQALAGVDGVFLAVPVHPDETRLGLNGVEAAKAAGVRRLVYLSVFGAETAAEIPHFASKVPIERAIRASGIPFTILRPNYFFQNDLGVAQVIAAGVYPVPIGPVGVSAVDVRDIAVAAVNALTESGHEGHTYPLAGRDCLTGEAFAAAYGRHLGRQVVYGGDDLDAWAEGVKAFMPDWLVRDIRIMFERFQRHGLAATKDDLVAVRRVLGREPRRHDDFAAELAAQVKAGG
jgi:uncharacterized protein YbjT (DUF2867 family)